MNRKKVFEKHDNQNTFIRETVPESIKSSQKAALNLKGNQLFNAGNIEAAKRVFMTTGYTDGLSRVGDFYKSKNRSLEALRMYWMAPDKKKSTPLIEQLAYVLQGLINEDENEDYTLHLRETENNDE
jgi:hypothetical protein